MKLLIIGGNNFIGGELVRQAVAAGHDVHVLSLVEPKLGHWHKLNRENITSLRKLFADHSFDVVIDNIAFTRWHVDALLSVMKGRAVKKYVLTSTIEVYANAVPIPPIEEQARLTPNAELPTVAYVNYLRGKRGCELALNETLLDIEWSILRPSMVIGPDDHLTGRGQNQLKYGRSLYYPARSGGPIILHESDYKSFGLVWYADVAAALLMLAEPSSITNKQAYNASGFITTSEGLVKTFNPVVKIVRTSDEVMLEHGITPKRPYATLDLSQHWLFANSSKLRALGWVPTEVQDWSQQLLKANQVATVKRLDREQLKAEAKLAATFETAKRLPTGATPSRIGIGTYLGVDDDATDELYEGSLLLAAERGITTIDTASNYRAGRSEKLIGRLIAEGKLERSRLHLITKGGYASKELTSRLSDAEKANGFHSVEPAYIMASLSESLRRLGTGIDTYLIHNPEHALRRMTAEELYQRLAAVFNALEHKVNDGAISSYGIATWRGLLGHPSNPNCLSLERLCRLAEVAGGPNHHFKAVELPYNSTEHTADTFCSQLVNGELMTAFDACQALSLRVFTSNTVMRGVSNAEELLADSCSHQLITTSLIGMRSKEHVASAAKYS